MPCRFARTSIAALLAGAGLAGAGGGLAGASVPPDDDTDDVLERFTEFAERSGITLLDPACTAATADPDAEFTCYARTPGGEPFIAIVTIAPGGVVEYDIVAAPGDGRPEATAPDRDAGDDDDGARFDPLAYFSALFSGDPSEIAALRGLTGAGSPADAYVVYQLVFAQTLADFGGELQPSYVFLARDGVRLCVTEDVCVPVSEFEVVDGQLVDFTVDGNEIAPRLGRPGEVLAAGPASVQVTAAYRAVTGLDSLRVYVELSSTADAIFEMSKAVYVGTDGELTPVDRDTSIGALDGIARDPVTIALDFPGADPGGELRFLLFPRGRDPLPVIVPVLPVTEEVPRGIAGR